MTNMTDEVRNPFCFEKRDLPTGVSCPRSYQVILMTSAGSMTVSGSPYRLSAGDLVLLTPSDICYAAEPCETASIVWQYTPEELMNDLSAFEEVVRAGGVYPAAGQSDDVRSLTARATAQAENPGERTPLIARMMLLELLLHLTESSPAKKGEGKVARAAAYLGENYALQVSLDTLCLAIGVSKFYLCRAFGRETGLTPHAYLNLVRVLAAERLMEEGTGAMVCATLVGFHDYTTFFRSYKKVTGHAPSGVTGEEE